jgi:hypothetical protein
MVCWVPGHTGLLGIEVADVAAKPAALHGVLGFDVRVFLCRAVLSSWQDE